jgi:hypothetical protein
MAYCYESHVSDSDVDSVEHSDPKREPNLFRVYFVPQVGEKQWIADFGCVSDAMQYVNFKEGKYFH